MKIHRILIVIMAMLAAFLNNWHLQAESTQSFKNIKVAPEDKLYAASLLLENADLDEIIRILGKHTGAEIKVVKPPVRNTKTTLEFHFTEKGPARKLVWHGKKATVKTYVTGDVEEKPVEINIKDGDQGKVKIKLGRKISVEYTNIRLEELLKRFSDLGGVNIGLDEALKKEEIRVNLKMKNFSPEEALKTLARMENLEIKQLDETTYFVTKKN